MNGHWSSRCDIIFPIFGTQTPCLHSADSAHLSRGTLVVAFFWVVDGGCPATHDCVASQIVHSYWFSRTSTTIWYHWNTKTMQIVKLLMAILWSPPKGFIKPVAAWLVVNMIHQIRGPLRSLAALVAVAMIIFSFSFFHRKTITDGSCIVAQVSAGVLSPPGPLR